MAPAVTQAWTKANRQAQMALGKRDPLVQLVLVGVVSSFMPLAFLAFSFSQEWLGVTLALVAVVAFGRVDSPEPRREDNWVKVMILSDWHVRNLASIARVQVRWLVPTRWVFFVIVGAGIGWRLLSK
jgi:hypothetical protein